MFQVIAIDNFGNQTVVVQAGSRDQTLAFFRMILIEINRGLAIEEAQQAHQVGLLVMEDPAEIDYAGIGILAGETLGNYIERQAEIQTDEEIEALDREEHLNILDIGYFLQELGPQM